MIEPLKSVTLVKPEGRGNRSALWALILENGNLELQRSDYGPLVEELWGRDEYEYNVTVPAAYKDTLLLLLLQEHFADDRAFKDWLEAKGIPYQTSSWP